MKSHEMTVEAKGTNAIKMWKVLWKTSERESINEIGKTEGVVLLTEFHLIGSNLVA